MNGLWKLVDVQYADTGETRTDGRYPERIGSIYKDLYIQVGKSAYLEYVFDQNGESKFGMLRTSPVKKYEVLNDYITIYTENSIFVLNKYTI